MSKKLIKLSDFVFNFVESIGVKHVFMLPGGGCTHLVDSLGKNPNIDYICNLHEQAAAIAAEAYARITNNIGVALVTSGPGGTNTLTGVIGAWLDSIPILIISGQVKRETTIINNPGLRQLGDQEINIVDIVKPVTKYAVMITDKNKIKYHLQKAVHLAESGRPGPVWIDIPLDVQAAYVDEKSLKNYTCPDKNLDFDSKIDVVVDLLKKSKRPVIIAGNGIRLSKSVKEFRTLVERLKIPVIGTFVGYDIIPSTNSYYFGRYGTMGQRAGNFIVQNADLILAIGARLNIRAISYNYKSFAREAVKIVVDIDPAELKKSTLKIDVPIQQNAKKFVVDLLKGIRTPDIKDNWLKRCLEYKTKYPNITPERENVKKFVDSYYFFKKLSGLTKDGTVFAFGNGSACVSSYQSLDVKPNQRVVVNSGCASMGYDLPAAIGACFANNKKEVVCVTGDGSIQLNIQELQTIVYHKLPIKIFVLNNQGYISIRNTQKAFFNGFFVGASKESGISFPDMVKIAKAYGIKTLIIRNNGELETQIKKALSCSEAILCEVKVDPEEKMYPKISSEKKEDGTLVSKPLEDMYPFLTREEFKKDMIITPLKE
jgi:acetolactate synthase I/II/III large subunit